MTGFDDMFRDFERWIKESELRFQRLMEEMMKGFNEPGVQSWGYSIYMDNTMDKPIVKTFGSLTDNLVPTPIKGLTEGGKGVKEPYTEVSFLKDENKYNVIVELPGIEKKDIEIKADERELKIKAETDNRKYIKTIVFDKLIQHDKIKARFKNGILELSIPLKEDQKEQEYTVKID